MNLTDDVKKTEFPNMRLQSPNGKKVIMTFKNGQNVVIGTEQPDGTYDSEVYEFSDIQDNVTFPDSPDFPEFLAKLKLDQFNGIVNSDSRDDYNNNVKHIENTVNGLVDYSLNQKGYFYKLKSSFGDFKGLILKIINFSVAKFMHDEVEVKYYKKDDVDKKIDDLQAQINNLTNAVTYKPDGSQSSVFPPSYTGDRDINDKISDAVIKQHVENLSNEDMKGDNN